MKIRLLWVAIVAMTLGTGCANNVQSEENPATPALGEALPGTWEAISLEVQVNTFQNSDSAFVFAIKEENWESTLGVKPKRTVFQLDNKFRSEFRALNDSIIDLQRGIWNVFGDTLMMIESDATVQYEVNLRSGVADFRSMIDWDGDGQPDDEMLEIYRYIGKGTE